MIYDPAAHLARLSAAELERVSVPHLAKTCDASEAYTRECLDKAVAELLRAPAEEVPE